MGASQSASASFHSEELLDRLSGNAAIEHQDVFWKQLLFHAFPAPLASISPEEVHTKLSPHCQQLSESALCGVPRAVASVYICVYVCFCCCFPIKCPEEEK